MIGNSEGPTLGWSLRGCLIDEQIEMSQAARDLDRTPPSISGQQPHFTSSEPPCVWPCKLPPLLPLQQHP